MLGWRRRFTTQTTCFEILYAKKIGDVVYADLFCFL